MSGNSKEVVEKTKPNAFVKKKTKKEKVEAKTKQSLVGTQKQKVITNKDDSVDSTDNYLLPTYTEGETFMLPLHMVEIYEHNPRNAVNEDYDAIYHSIKTTGFRGSFTITLIPGREVYTLSAGEGSRYRACLQLFEETKDNKYSEIRVTYYPYQGESMMLFNAWSENGQRDDLCFADNAAAIMMQVRLEEKRLNKDLSIREASKFLSSLGYTKVGTTNYGAIKYCYDHVLPHIPNLALKHQKQKGDKPGIGAFLVSEIRKYYKTSEETYINSSLNHTKEEWNTFFFDTLESFDSKEYFDIDEFKEALVSKLNKDNPDASEAMERYFDASKQKNTTPEANLNENNSESMRESKNEDTDDSRDDLEDEEINTEPKKEVSSKVAIKSLRDSIYDLVSDIVSQTNLKSLLKKNDKGIGVLYELPNDELSEIESCLWWILYTLNPEDYFFELSDYQQWESKTNKNITLKIITSARRTFTQKTNSLQIKKLQKIESEILELIKLTK